MLVIVGFRSAIVPEAAGVVELPVVPPSYRGTSKEGPWLEEAVSKSQFEQSFSKLTATPTDIYAVAPRYKRVFVNGATDEDPNLESPLSVRFMQWLLGLYPNAFPRVPFSHMGIRAGFDESQRLVMAGFDVASFCRLVGVDASKAGFNVPVGFWYGNRDAFDPYEMLTDSDQRKWLLHAGACTLAGVKPPAVDWKPHLDAKTDARIAAELIFRHNLVAVDSAAPQFTMPKFEEPAPLDEIVEPETAAEQEAEAEAEQESEAALDAETETPVESPAPPIPPRRRRVLPPQAAE